jgi:hypothetical protein
LVLFAKGKGFANYFSKLVLIFLSGGRQTSGTSMDATTVLPLLPLIFVH